MSTIKQNGLYAAYLRKSRRDVEMEALGQGETLARHERQLRDLAGRLGIAVSRWYREIVSGDTIAERPQVRQLLEDVGAGLWDGVLVVDLGGNHLAAPGAVNIQTLAQNNHGCPRFGSSHPTL